MTTFTIYQTETISTSYTDRVWYEVDATTKAEAIKKHEAGKSKEVTRKDGGTHEKEVWKELVKIEPAG